MRTKYAMMVPSLFEHNAWHSGVRIIQHITETILHTILITCSRNAHTTA
jgi:hypothetical protein